MVLTILSKRAMNLLYNESNKETISYLLNDLKLPKAYLSVSRAILYEYRLKYENSFNEWMYVKNNIRCHEILIKNILPLYFNLEATVK
jgi:hypothetical protein